MKNIKTFTEFLNESTINEAKMGKQKTSKVGPFKINIQHGDYASGNDEGMFEASIGKLADVESYMVPSDEYGFLVDEGYPDGEIKDIKAYMAKIVKLSSTALKPSGEIKNQPAFEKLKLAIESPVALFGAETYNGWTTSDGEGMETDIDYIHNASYIVAKSTLYIDWFENYKK